MILVLFVFGLFVGSFLGVLVDRIPRGEQFSSGRSYCEKCGHSLSGIDLIPVFSFLFLRGKCRYCHAHLSSFYPVIELVTGALFALTLYPLTFASSLQLAIYLCIISAFIVIFFTDIKYGIIPDKILVPGAIATLIWILLFHQSLLLGHILSALGASLFFLIIFALTRGRGMGFGDVKLSFLIGLILGFPGTLFAIYLAFLTGAILSIILVLTGRKRLKGSTIPFGPFLVGGALVNIYLGEQIKSVFFKIFGIA